MTIIEFIDILRTRLVDTTEPYLWSDEVLLQLINETVEDISRRANLYTEAYSIIPIVKNVTEYTTNGVVMKCNIYDKDTNMREEPLIYSPPNIIRSKLRGTTNTGRPTYYSNDLSTGTFIIYPIPDDSYYLMALLTNIPIYTMSSTFDFPNQELCILGVMSRAFAMPDTETYNSQAFQIYRSMYIDALNDFKGKFIRDTSISEVSTIHKGLL
jgi:hypothetical protein